MVSARVKFLHRQRRRRSRKNWEKFLWIFHRLCVCVCVRSITILAHTHSKCTWIRKFHGTTLKGKLSFWKEISPFYSHRDVYNATKRVRWTCSGSGSIAMRKLMFKKLNGISQPDSSISKTSMKTMCRKWRTCACSKYWFSCHLKALELTFNYRN